MKARLGCPPWPNVLHSICRAAYGVPNLPLPHLSTNYMTLPPTLSPEPKFGFVILPTLERHHDIDEIIYVGEGPGSHDTEEFVIETSVCGGQNRSRGKRAVESNPRGWKSPHGFCELKELAHLGGLRGPNKTPAEMVCALGALLRHYIIGLSVNRLPLWTHHQPLNEQPMGTGPPPIYQGNLS